MWEELKDTYRYYGWRFTKNEQELSIVRTLTQCRTVLKSAERPDRLRGKGLNGVIFDEYADIDPITFTNAIRPALSDKLGWARFYGTPKGFNHFYTLFNEAKSKDDWGVFQNKTIDSPFFQTPAGLAELEAARLDLDEKTFRQEYEASFETFGGRVYYAFDRLLHNTDISYDKNLPLIVGQDFNRTPMASCLFQVHAGISIQFAELSLNSSSTDEVCQVIKQRYPEAMRKGVIFRPDATGSRRTSNSSQSDFDIIRDHGFKIEAGSINPNRVDRWAAVNRAFERGLSKINVKNCPKTVKDFEAVIFKQASCDIDNRDPLLTHSSDAHGYHIIRQHPLSTPHSPIITQY